MPYVNDLPKKAESLYLKAYMARKPENWYLVVRACIKAGERDPAKLADIPFFLYHPEVSPPRALKSHENWLIMKWRMWYGYIVYAMHLAAVETKRREDGSALRTWLGKLDLSKIKPKKAHHSKVSEAVRRANLERLRSYLVDAMDNPGYDTSYWNFIYYDGLGRKRGPYERTHQVLSVERVQGKQDLLKNLKRMAIDTGNDFEDFSEFFVDAEHSLYVNLDVMLRFVRGTATNDGPSEFAAENGYLRDLHKLVTQNERSIYSVYSEEIKGAWKYMNDPNPTTAGLPF